MVEQLKYDQLPAEYSVRADLPQIMFRKLRQQVRGVGPAGRGRCRPAVSGPLPSSRACCAPLTAAAARVCSLLTSASACPPSGKWHPSSPAPPGRRPTSEHIAAARWRAPVRRTRPTKRTLHPCTLASRAPSQRIDAVRVSAVSLCPCLSAFLSCAGAIEGLRPCMACTVIRLVVCPPPPPPPPPPANLPPFFRYPHVHCRLTCRPLRTPLRRSSPNLCLASDRGLLAATLSLLFFALRAPLFPLTPFLFDHRRCRHDTRGTTPVQHVYLPPPVKPKLFGCGACVVCVCVWGGGGGGGARGQSRRPVGARAGAS